MIGYWHEMHRDQTVTLLQHRGQEWQYNKSPCCPRSAHDRHGRISAPAGERSLVIPRPLRPLLLLLEANQSRHPVSLRYRAGFFEYIVMLEYFAVSR